MPLAWVKKDDRTWRSDNGQFEITADYEITLTYRLSDKLYSRSAAFHTLHEAQDKASEWSQAPPAGV